MQAAQMEKLEALASVIVPSASSPRGRGGGGGSSGSLGPCSAPSGGGSATATPASCGIRPGTGGACCATPTGTCDAPASARFRCGCGCTSGTMLPVKSAHSTMRSCTQAFRTESGHRQGVPSHLGDVAEPEASRSQARAAGCAAGAPRRSCTLPWAAGCAIPAAPQRAQMTVARLGTETLWAKACACLMGGEGAASLEQLLAVRVRAFVNIDRSHPPLGVCHGERFLPQTPRSGTVDIDYPSSPVPITFTWSYLLW